MADGGVLRNLFGRLFRRPERIADVEALERFLDERAAFLTQKGIVEFCRVRAGGHWQKLFGEAEFQQALTLSRWRGYPLALAMLAEMVEAALREAAGVERLRLSGTLSAAAARLTAKYPVPAGESGDFWEISNALIAATLAEAQSRPARPVAAMPDPLAKKFHKALPLHQNLVAPDYDYIFNFLRMNLLRAHDDFVAQADAPALLADLLGGRGKS